uniref:Uncharacterized protein n=1 Tax=Arundo donax TaxID=35708 RepID=A0A0A8YYS8_ARUDO
MSRDFITRPFMASPIMTAFQQGVPFSSTMPKTFSAVSKHPHFMYMSMRLVPSTILMLYWCCLMYSCTDFPFSRADRLVHAEMTLTNVTSSGLIPWALMLS